MPLELVKDNETDAALYNLYTALRDLENVKPETIDELRLYECSVKLKFLVEKVYGTGDMHSHMILLSTAISELCKRPAAEFSKVSLQDEENQPITTSQAFALMAATLETKASEGL